MNTWKTREVKIGKILIGGKNSVKIQSMINIPLDKTDRCLDQIMNLYDNGCEIIRMAIIGNRDIPLLEKLKSSLIKKGYDVALVADIHFLPKAALLISDFVDKIRINPGNFYNPKVEDHFFENLEKLILPLVEKCKKRDVSIRVGVNHGSLSHRIMEKHGNSTLGMVISALEYIDIFRKFDFHQLVISMKSSSSKIMVDAYRLLVLEQMKRGLDYPLHLGVTESGFGLSGRIKSSVGIGALLLDGIGDTIRVSLSEDPVNEISPAKKLSKLKNVATKLSCIDFKKPKQTIKCFFNFDGLKKDEILVDKIDDWEKIKSINPKKIFLKLKMPFSKQFILWHYENKLESEIVLLIDEEDELVLSSEIGALIFDNLIFDICLNSKKSLVEKKQILDEILQGSEKVFTKAQIISCPTCGRTNYNLQKVAKQIKAKTEHLVGIKIAVMGCMVNGPGEMSEADFGYIGSKNNQVNLFVNGMCVKKNICENDAVCELINLIKAHGKWKDQ
jgi:(E)-4-hydroxy-3-methylbut-2-enyl-diphosphate synthase